MEWIQFLLIIFIHLLITQLVYFKLNGDSTSWHRHNGWKYLILSFLFWPGILAFYIVKQTIFTNWKN